EEPSDDAPPEEGLGGHHASRLERRQPVEVDGNELLPVDVREATFRHAPDERHLTPLEALTGGIAVPGLLPLVAAAGRLPLPRARPAALPPGLPARALRRADVRKVHEPLLSFRPGPTISTRWQTEETIPRMAGLSG